MNSVRVRVYLWSARLRACQSPERIPWRASSCLKEAKVTGTPTFKFLSDWESFKNTGSKLGRLG